MKASPCYRRWEPIQLLRQKWSRKDLSPQSALYESLPVRAAASFTTPVPLVGAKGLTFLKG